MKERRSKPREQGDIGELSAMDWLATQGAHVYVPVGHSPDVDIVAELGGRLIRVEVKTSTHRNEIGRWAVVLATRGGNQSWTGLVKYFDPGRCDYLFAHVGDGRRWMIPTSELDGKAGLTLGGPKYAEFEIELGRPLRADRRARARIVPARGSAGVGEPGRSVKSVPSAEWVRFPPPPSLSGLPEPDRQRRAELVPVVGRTKLSANHQLTIPRRPFEAAGVKVGDALRVEAVGPGQIEITRIEDYMERLSEQLKMPTSTDAEG